MLHQKCCCPVSAEFNTKITVFDESQVLRYPYFHVGQVLGAPQQIQDQGQTQPPQLRPDHSHQIPPIALPETAHKLQHVPEPPKRLGKAEVKTDRTVQSRFPIIHDKGLQSKVSEFVWKCETSVFKIE